MKEAAGEANMTVITVVLIGIVAGVGLLLIPRLMGNIQKKACCTDNAGIWKDGTCNPSDAGFNEEEYKKCVTESGGKI